MALEIPESGSTLTIPPLLGMGIRLAPSPFRSGAIERLFITSAAKSPSKSLDLDRVLLADDPSALQDLEREELGNPGS